MLKSFRERWWPPQPTGRRPARPTRPWPWSQPTTTTNPTTATAKASTLLSVPAKSVDNGSRQCASSTIFPKRMFYQTSSVSVLSLVLVKRLRNGNKHSACFIPCVTSCYSCWVGQIHVSVFNFWCCCCPLSLFENLFTSLAKKASPFWPARFSSFHLNDFAMPQNEGDFRNHNFERHKKPIIAIIIIQHHPKLR